MFLYRLKRHPFKIQAYFDFSLAVSFAYPVEVLAPLLPPGLSLDTHSKNEKTYAFLTIAMVKVRQLRPAPLPAQLGQNFFLTGYRLFVKYRSKAGKTLRGLYILRSDSNKQLMTIMGSLLSHYSYNDIQLTEFEDSHTLNLSIKTPKSLADLDLSVDLTQTPIVPPQHSPFTDLQTARRFAGPMPYTFSYEPQTHSIVMIEGRRQHWQPQNVAVDIQQATYLEQAPFNQVEPLLANAFMVRDVPYMWQRGTVEKL